jgi:asparagine synthase (glutamine-hydrolysing)
MRGAVMARSFEARDSAPARARAVVEAAVERNFAPALLLSGGLDTSIIAHVAAPLGLKDAVTVLAAQDAPDGPHAISVARRLRLRHHIASAGLEDVLFEAPFVCRIMRTFDPMEVRNSSVVARGLRQAAWLGLRQIMTGDGADELFGGYSFMWSKGREEFRASTRRMAGLMRFSSFPLGEALGVRVRAPFLDPVVKEFALSLGKGNLVGEREGATHGKLVLREAFPEVENRWRRKDPIETGSGSSRAPEFFRSRVTKDDLARETRRILADDGVEIRDAEHLACYEAFTMVFQGRPPLVRDGSDPCPKCRYQMPARASDFCATCGAWPVPPRA